MGRSRGRGVIYCSRSFNQEPHTLGSHRTGRRHGNPHGARVEQPHLSKSYLIWQGGSWVVVLVTEKLDIWQPALESPDACLIFFCQVHSFQWLGVRMSLVPFVQPFVAHFHSHLWVLAPSCQVGWPGVLRHYLQVRRLRYGWLLSPECAQTSDIQDSGTSCPQSSSLATRGVYFLPLPGLVMELWGVD